MIQVLKNFIGKLRDLPHLDRLVIFFVVMVLATVLMGYLAFRSTMRAIPNLSSSLSSLNQPSN